MSEMREMVGNRSSQGNQGSPGSEGSRKKVVVEEKKRAMKSGSVRGVSKEHGQGSEVGGIFLAVVQGVGVAAFVLFLLLFLAAFFVDKEWFGQEHFEGIVLVSYVIASLMGGIYASVLVGKYSLLVGTFVGLLLFLLFFALGLCIYPESSFGSEGMEVLFASLVGGGMAKIFYQKKRKNH